MRTKQQSERWKIKSLISKKENKYHRDKQFTAHKWMGDRALFLSLPLHSTAQDTRTELRMESSRHARRWKLASRTYIFMDHRRQFNCIIVHLKLTIMFDFLDESQHSHLN